MHFYTIYKYSLYSSQDHLEKKSEDEQAQVAMLEDKTSKPGTYGQFQVRKK